MEQALQQTPSDFQIAIYDLIMGYPPAVVQNWLRILSQCPDHITRCLRVLYGVGNIGTRNILTRFKVPNCPDGQYIIRDHDTLQKKGPMAISRTPAVDHWGHYFDPESGRPDPDALAKSGPVFVTYAMALAICAKCEDIRQERGSPSAVFDQFGLYSASRQGELLPLPSNLVFAHYDPMDLSLAFRETIKWANPQTPGWEHTTGFYMMRVNDPQRNMPLVLGTEWSNCVLVLPGRSYYD